MATPYTPTEAIEGGLKQTGDENSPGLRIHAKGDALRLATVNTFGGRSLSIKSIPVGSLDEFDAYVDMLASLRKPVKAWFKANKQGKGLPSNKDIGQMTKADLVAMLEQMEEGQPASPVIRRSKGKKAVKVTPERSFDLALAGVHGNTRATLERVLSQPHCKVVAKKAYKAFKAADGPLPMTELRALVKKVQSKASKR